MDVLMDVRNDYFERCPLIIWAEKFYQQEKQSELMLDEKLLINYDLPPKIKDRDMLNEFIRYIGLQNGFIFASTGTTPTIIED